MVEIIVPGAPDPDAPPVSRPAPVAMVDDFLPAGLAAAMRQAIDTHFSNPNAHRGETHQIWNYWFVPGLYTYLRTRADRVIDQEHVRSFILALREWSVENLGLGSVTLPNLSLYVSGCRQGWHNDSTNGRFAFVYSLTRDDRATSGGETLVMRDGDALRANLTWPAAGQNLYEAVAPRFNRLVVFDDRAPHAVQQVDGSMDPAEGRFVLHGHLSEAGPVITGALPPEVAVPLIEAVPHAFAREHGVRLAPYQGPLALRFLITAAGVVENCDVIMDRVLHPHGADTAWEPLREALLERLEATRFPSAPGETKVVLPVMFGPRPRNLR